MLRARSEYYYRQNFGELRSRLDLLTTVDQRAAQLAAR
jgi:hypothetical protein